MSFRKSITTIVTPSTRQTYDAAFATNYSERSADVNDVVNGITVPKTQTSTSNPAADINAAKDAMFAYSSNSGYSAISEGLVYLQRVAAPRTGARTQMTMSSGDNTTVDFQSMSPSQGVPFVKTALGLNVVERVGNDSLQQSATRYSEQVFASLQSNTFSPSAFYDDGVEISRGAYTAAMSSTYANADGNAVSNYDALNSDRQTQRRLFFLGGPSRINVEQDHLAQLGRMPEMKFKFLFYCDITLWNGTVHRLAAVKSVTGAQAVMLQDEVNFYGLRSTVNKGVRYTNATVTLHDDANNQGMRMALDLLSKSTGAFGSMVEHRQRGLQDITGTDTDFVFQDGNVQQATTNVLDERNGIVRHIKVTQVYIQGQDIVKDVFTYINPKIVSITKSDFDMDGTGEVQSIAIEFSFDALNAQIAQTETPFWRQRREMEFTF